MKRRTLPVFAVSDAAPGLRTVHALASLFLGEDISLGAGVEIGAGITRYRAGQVTIYLHERTSALWIADDALWQASDLDGAQADTHGAAPPSAPSPRLDNLVNAVQRTGDRARLRVEPAWRDGTRLVIWERTHWTRSERWLDRSNGYTVHLDAADHDLDGVPLTGPGVVLTTRAAADGRPLAFHAALPALTGRRYEYPVADRTEADRAVRERFAEFDDLRLEIRFTYRIAWTTAGRCLCPHWSYSGSGRLAGRDVPLPDVHVPAVEIGAAIHAEGRRGALEAAVRWDGNVTSPRLFVSWLGERAGRLGLSRPTVDRLVPLMVRQGWQCIDAGEDRACEAHWNRLAASGIREADLVAYIGHAAEYGLKLMPPDAAWLDAADCRFGGRLKWVVVDGCGPLQDHVAGGNTSAFDHWARAFDGVRSLLGFASAQEQNDRQLPLAIEYALGGEPIARAWFQAVCERQGSRTNRGAPAWVAGLFAVEHSTTTIDDRLTDLELPSIAAPERLAGVWVPLG